MRYDVTRFDDSVDGMEPLRNQDEFILLASAHREYQLSDLREQWHDDIESCDRFEGFDYDAAHAAVDHYCDCNVIDLAMRLGQLENPDYCDEDGYATFRLYVQHDGKEV